MRPADRPLSALFQDIIGNVQALVRAELRLARTEVAEQMGKARAGAIWLTAGAFAALLSLLFLLVTVMYALRLVVPAWAAALIVGVGVGALSALCLLLARQQFKTIQAPPKTAASLKENVQWARQLTK